MIWAPEETYSREEIECIQLRKLKQTVAYIYEKVPAYRRKMEEAGVKPTDIQKLSDLQKLPFTNKSDFKEITRTGCLLFRAKSWFVFTLPLVPQGSRLW